ncbi:hsp70 family protein [Candidatus Magnetomonas plexicatena]|uniref:hsp70 family protein n=1 Tax=Candidatus Magnetomonas plexicatena TaxID=2552947 RepID=UPI001C78CC57|nr:Hsp70 family protein [Nitrospirales bacterium LBB_01]
MNKKTRFIVGIDLGTTNSAVSYIDTEDKSSNKKKPHELKKAPVVFDIPQFVDDGIVGKISTLPSFLYIPGAYDAEIATDGLPWQTGSEKIITGEYARIIGGKKPSNLVYSAKSWLCYSRVDRNAPILPWGREDTAGKLSPVSASAAYLKHIINAWNSDGGGVRGKYHPLQDEQVAVTIPASFDETARELTFKAAELAGFKNLTMLEEPQAAFYSWISQNEANLGDIIKENTLVLVFDMGGGTTDFNLITVEERGGKPEFKRVAVGDHLMLGGDNMDLALAREVEESIFGAGQKMGIAGWTSLTHQCRKAKETLLSEQSVNEVEVTFLGSGRSVIGGSVKGVITSNAAKNIVLNGFFKHVGIDEDVTERRLGFQELGLPYVSETAVFKHLSAFLKRHAANPFLAPWVKTADTGGVRAVRPDAVLFNGGVFKSASLRKASLDMINHWFSPSEPNFNVKELENDKLDHAVALGAAYYGLVLRGEGVRITGGTGKSYYIEVAHQSAAPSELKSPLTSVCILPRGAEPDNEITLTEPEFQVMANTPASFNMFSSSYRVGDKPGDIVTAEQDFFFKLPPVKTILQFGKKSGTAHLPVTLSVKLNEYGTLDIWCESKTTPHRWRLSFQLRDAAASDDTSEETAALTDTRTLDQETSEQACEAIRAALWGNEQALGALTKTITEIIGVEKDNWPLPVIRKLWDTLMELKQRRLITPVHEARWLNMSGFLLRPGFGYLLDTERIKELWKIFSEGVKFYRYGGCCLEWWIMWRRVAGGLSEQNQDIIFKKTAQHLIPGRKKKDTPKLQNPEVLEFWMLTASLERLGSTAKVELGDELLRQIKKFGDKNTAKLMWALSRLGGRVPFYGPVEKVIPKAAAEKWIREIMALKWTHPADASYAISQLARKTGDRAGDTDDALREEASRWIQKVTAGAAERYIKRLSEALPVSFDEEREVFGDTLPVGLIINKGK